MSEVTQVRVVVPPMSPSAEVGLVRVAPSGEAIAFVERRQTEAFVRVADVGASEAHDLVELGAYRAHDLQWSPDGQHLAYVLRHGDPLDRRRFVGWCGAASPDLAGPPGELGRVEGAAVEWMAAGLVVADASAGELLRVSLSGEVARLCPYRDDGGIEQPPALAMAAHGELLAFSTRLAEGDVSGIWTLDLSRPKQLSNPAPTLLTQIPGADAEVRLFWPPVGLSLGMLIVHPSLMRSAIILVPGLTGEGEVIHQSQLLDRPVRPVWSPDAARLFFVRAQEEGVFGLVAIDPSSLSLSAVHPDIGCDPRFLRTGELALDGADHAYILTPPFVVGGLG